jgi:hypothetical protein
MKTNTVFIVVLLLSITGCATVTPPPAPQVEYVDLPPLNSEASAEIGETLVAKGKIYVFEGLELLDRITDNGIAREYILEAGSMRLERTDSDGSKFFAPPGDSYYVNDKAFGRRVKPLGGYLILRPNGELELTGYYDLTNAGKVFPTAPRFRAGKVLDRAQPNFRQELIYGGRVGSQLRLTYREYAGDLIRPGFAQEAQYDISAESVIGFKGVRIEIIEATNTKLRYRVLKSFQDAP